MHQDNPDAYLIYKPHPDVEAGLRAGKVDKQTLALVDEVVSNVAMPDCLDVVDEIHTISSLTGFEALLRKKKVVCYGLPFYAGWGLTTEKGTDSTRAMYAKRRERKEPLTKEQLVYCALIRYPLYRVPDGYGLAQVEQVIDYLYPNLSSKRSNVDVDGKDGQAHNDSNTDNLNTDSLNTDSSNEGLGSISAPILAPKKPASTKAVSTQKTHINETEVKKPADNAQFSFNKKKKITSVLKTRANTKLMQLRHFLKSKN